MALPDDTAGRYAAVSNTFTQLVTGTNDWAAPAPVDGWTAADVVWHLVGWVPGVMNDGAGLGLPSRDPLETDPAAAWARFDSALRSALARPGVLAEEFAHPQAGTMPVGVAVDMLVTPDVFLHAWDLAQATGQPLVLDPDYSASLLAGMEGVEDMLRSSGHYGSRVEVPDDADVQTRLVAFIGRDPDWSAR